MVTRKRQANLTGSDSNTEKTIQTTESDAVASLNKQKLQTQITGNDNKPEASKPEDKSEQTEADKKIISGSDDAEKVEEKQDSKTEEKSEQPAPQMVTVDSLANVISKAIADALKPVQDELKATKDELETVKKQDSNIIQVLNSKGEPNPTPQTQQPKVNDSFTQMFNTKYGVGSGLKDAALDFVKILEDKTQTPSVVYIDSIKGDRFVQRDYTNLTRFWRKNKDSVREGMEAYAKKHGLLQGWRSSQFQDSNNDAATLKADIPDAFLAYLSMVVRETHSPTYIYWQFAYEGLELGKGAGDTIKVPRFAFLPVAANIAARQLTPGTAIGASNQNLSQGSVTIALEELGLPTPVAIPEFISAWSLLNLENVLQVNLGHDWEDYRDLRLRTMLMTTTRVVYNSRNAVETNPANVQITNTSGVSGIITLEFLNNLFAYMRSLKIPTYANGYYVLCLHTTALAQLKNGLQPDAFDMDGTVADIANLLIGSNGGERERVSGYHGVIGGFMVFETNVHSLGVAGTEGAQNETVAGATRLTRTSLAFGQRPIARAVGMPMEVRRDANDDFGRMNRYIWLEHAGYGYLDVDPSNGGDSNQQLRVISIHSTDASIDT